MSVLELNQLTKNFSGNKVVDDVSFTLESGKIYGLLGPNGSGKSTLMKMVAGLYYPTSGTIKIMDDPINIASRSKVVFMTTENFLYQDMSIKNLGKFYNNFYSDFDTTYYKQLLHDLNLEENMIISKLSSGMLAKLKIAISLSRNTTLYMLDEPLNGVDFVARNDIIKAIINRSSDTNTLLISSHLIDIFESILDDIIFIKKGRIVLFNEAERIREVNKKSIVELYKEVYQNA